MRQGRFRAGGGTGFVALVMVAALAVAALAVAAAPADASALRAAYDTTTRAQAFRFASTRTVAVGTDVAPDVTFASNGEQVGQDRLHTSTTLTSGSIRLDPVETTQIGRDTYVHLPGALTPTGADQWLQLDVLGGLLSGIISPIALQQASPGDALALLNDVSDVQTVGDETINGVSTTHLRGTIDLAKATAGNGPLAGLGNIYGGPQSTVTVEVYVGKDNGLVRRLMFVSKADVDLSTLNLGSVLGVTPGFISTNALTNVTFDFTDYNVAGISVDPPARFMHVSDYLGNFNVNIMLANPQPTAPPAAASPTSTVSATATTTATATATATATTTATPGSVGAPLGPVSTGSAGGPLGPVSTGVAGTRFAPPNATGAARP